jgi:DNA-binding transcriptional LysR family regulator
MREQLLFDEPVHLVTSARGQDAGDQPAEAIDVAELAKYSGQRWIAGCDRCRGYLLRQCALAGFAPKISFTTDDYVAVQALVAADLGIATLPSLALHAARHPGIRTTKLRGARRYVYAVRYGEPPDSIATAQLIDALSAAAAAANRVRQPRPVASEPREAGLQSPA